MTGVSRGIPSRRSIVAAAALKLTERTGHAASQQEIEAEVRRVHGELGFVIANVIGGLCTTGDLVPVFGRPPHGRYAHCTHIITAVPTNEPMAAAVAVVTAGWKKTGREMPTREVTDGMRALGVDLKHPNNYSLLLTSLTQRSSRGAPTWREPKLIRRSVPTLGGQDRLFWRPVAEAAQSRQYERPPASQVDAAMEAVARTEAAIGRPPSSREIRLWIGVHADKDPVAHYLATNECLGRALGQLETQRVSRLVNTKGDWRCVETPFAVPGGCPKRYTTRPLTPTLVVALELEDRLRVFTPARELESQQALWSLAVQSHVPALHDILTLRIATLAAVARPSAADEILREAQEVIFAANEVLAGWAAQWPVNERSSKLAPYVALRAELAALERVPESAGKPTFLRVGCSAVASHGELLPYVSGVPTLLGRDYSSEVSLRMFYDTARRVVNPEARWESNDGSGGALIPADRTGLGWMIVDRVDALTAVWSTVGPPRATSLITGACTILGHVVRDHVAIRAALATSAGARGGVRRSLVVALALLGYAVALDEAVPDASDEQDTAAYVLARVLCSPERVQLTADIRAVAARASSMEARRTVMEASRMISTGALLTVVG